MPGVEGTLVQWAPSVAPLDSPSGGDWVTLPDWQSIKIRFGKTVDGVTKAFTVGTADIRVRNGDSTGNTPTFLPGTSYKGRNVQVVEASTVGTPFAGRIDSVEYHYRDSPFAGFVTLHCVDVLGNVLDGEIPDELFPATVDYFTQVADVETAVGLILEQAELPVLVGAEFSHQLVKAPDKFETRQALLDFLNQVLLTESATLAVDPATNDLGLRGRWQPLRVLAAGAPAPIVFTDTAPDGTTTFGYRRDDLQWSVADEDFVNSVQTRSIYNGDTVTEETVPTGYLKQQLSRTELVTIRQGWVAANARMWFKLYNQARAHPKKIKFMVGSRGAFAPSMFTAALTPNLDFDQQYQVLHTPPGSTQITYRLAVDYIEHDIDRSRWLCTLGFTSLDRWWFAYGNGTDPIELIQIGGDSDHGIGSTAIIAP